MDAETITYTYSGRIAIELSGSRREFGGRVDVVETECDVFDPDELPITRRLVLGTLDIPLKKGAEFTMLFPITGMFYVTGPTDVGHCKIRSNGIFSMASP